MKWLIVYSGGAPPPYKPRTFGDNSLPPYHEDNFDVDDASGDDPLPPPMPVLPHSSTIPGTIQYVAVCNNCIILLNI